MSVDIAGLRDALREIPNALMQQRFGEPTWISEVDPAHVMLTADPITLVSVGGATVTGPSATVADELPSSLLPIVDEMDRWGVDALAWYRTFREVGSPWGIYIRADGLHLVARQAFWGLDLQIDEMLALSFQVLLKHELAHFDIDVSVARMELLLHEALWQPRKKTISLSGSYDVEEEIVANAAMIRGINWVDRSLRVVGSATALREWTKTQPHGYRDGYRYTADDEFRESADELGELYLGCATRSFAGIEHVALRPILETRRPWAPLEVPVYLVYGYSGFRSGDIGLFPSIEIVAESSGFMKQLTRVPARTQRDYKELRERLRVNAPSYGDRFKKWPSLGGGHWSLRLNGGDRLHLRHLDGTKFEAVEIGDHRSLGHG